MVKTGSREDWTGLQGEGELDQLDRDEGKDSRTAAITLPERQDLC